MRYAKIKYPDVANGYGVRVSLFLQGCSRHCKGCFNEEAWDHEGGEEFTAETKAELFDYLGRYGTAGLSVLGGEPLEQSFELARLLSEVKERFPDKDIWLWTGWEYEKVSHYHVFKYVDVVVDGAYVEELRDISLLFRGSSNQRIIDLRVNRNEK